jgi:hypothetical protein
MATCDFFFLSKYGNFGNCFPKKSYCKTHTIGNITKLRGTKKLEKPEVVNSFVNFVTIKEPNKQVSIFAMWWTLNKIILNY